MAIIDADAHVIETEQTWNYLDEAESKFRPIIVASQDGRKQFWLIDGRTFSARPINTELPVSVKRDARDRREAQAHG